MKLILHLTSIASYTLDISNVTGSYYIGISLCNYDAYPSTMTFTSIKLE